MEEEHEEGFTIDLLNKTVFPMIYGQGSKSDDLANTIYDQLILYAKSKEECILEKNKDRENVLISLTRASPESIPSHKSMIIQFMCEYGCAIKLTKDKEHSPINIQIIALQKWATGAHACDAKKLQLVNPDGQSSIFTPTISIYSQDLQNFANQFKINLRMAFQIIRSREFEISKSFSEQFTTQQLEQACKIAVHDRPSFYRTEEKIQLQIESKQKNERASTIGQKISLKESQADTAWYVTKSVVINLLGVEREQKCRTEKFIIGFKGWLLKQATQQKAIEKKYVRSQVQKYKLCLDQLITQYKEKVSKTSKKIEKFVELITSIEKAILEIKGGKLTSQIEDKVDFYQKLDLAVGEQPSFIPFKQKIHKKQKIEEKEINEFKVEIGQQYMFQQLLDLHESIKGIQQTDMNKWILLTEKAIWRLTDLFCNDSETIDVKIHARQIQCEIEASTMGKVVLIYEKMMRKQMEYYGFQLKGQTQSHIELVKAITAVIAFQSVKLNREKRKSHLSEYRVPFDIAELFNNFHSNSKEARKAMKQLHIYHNYRKLKKKIFELSQHNNDFFDFGRKVAQETRSAKIWLQNMENMQEVQKQLRVSNLKVMQLESNKNMAINYVQHASYYLGQTSSSFAIQCPNSSYSANDPFIYAFINNIPPDVLGMIKLCYYAQNPMKSQPLKEETNLYKVNSLFPEEQLPIKIYSKKNSNKQTLASQSTKDQITCLNPQSKVNILYGDSFNSLQYKLTPFYQEISQFSTTQTGDTTSTIRRLLTSPEGKCMTRQHEVYSSLLKKPEDMDLQNFQAMGNVRSAEQTQLILLCSSILERKIISNSYDVGSLFAERLILQTGGRLSAYHRSTEKYFGKIEQLIREFIKHWYFTDTTFCPIIAPLLTFLAQEIVDDELVDRGTADQLIHVYYQLSLNCWEEFKRAEQQLQANPEQKIQWDQKFVCMSSICCFREAQLNINDAEQIQFFLSLIFQMRVSKILSDRQQRPPKKRAFQTQLEFQVEKAIFRNIKAISEYVNSHHDKLSAIVAKLDHSFPEDVIWKKVNLIHYRGVSQQSQEIYQLNIYTGCIYKNGKQISCLDDIIKQNIHYIEIFGKDREFQVFPSHYKHYLRTKANVNYQFKINEKKEKVYFEFSEDGKEIRYVIKQEGKKLDEEIWTLIPRRQLKHAKCHIPQLFLRNYLAWYSDKRKCVTFRKPTFDRIFEIGLVIFLENKNALPTIISTSHITYHGSYENQVLDELCDPKNPKYQELILRGKEPPLQKIKPFQVLSRFEPTQFIFELKNRKTNQIHYYLHRYQLRFKVTNGSRLLSETYFGYALDHSFYSQKNSLFNQFPCLVFEKYLDSPSIANNHKRIMLVSNGTIDYDGLIDKPSDAKLHLSLYKYDIHDFFGDIRGANRQSLLHLATVMLSINDNIKIMSIEMTPLQYAMYLMKSCFTNRPLSEIQTNKLMNIFQLAKTEIVLLGEALWKMANSLIEVLPFSSELKNTYCPFWKFAEKFLMCRTLYENNYNNDTLKYRQKINKDVLTFLGVKLHESAHKKIDSSQSSSEQFQQGEHYWKGYHAYSGDTLVEKFSKIQEDYKEFQKETQKLNIWNQKSAKQSKIDFPRELSELTKEHRDDQMLSEMIGELANSFKVYCTEEDRIAEIAAKITKEEKKNQLNLINSLKDRGSLIVSRIEGQIRKMKQENQKHPDIITGIRPALSSAMYTSILCEKDLLLDYYPNICKTAAKLLKSAMKIWLELKTRTSSFQRIDLLLSQDKVDVVAVMREVLSPREEVFKKNQWLCFEAQMKVQLWPSQLETYKNLIDDQISGSFCQLNMGEGKTQVIIPLIILNTIYSNKGDKKCLPRINLLSSLFEQARSNFFRFISATGFQIPAFEIPFNRKVNLQKNQINSIKHLIDSFSNKAYILMTRESRLSEILRFHEGKIIRKNITANRQAYDTYQQKDRSFVFDLKAEDLNKSLIQNTIFDVFDEIDALMYSKKSYIFSIGDHLELAQDMMRFEILKLCIEVFLLYQFEGCLADKIVVTDQTNEDALQMVRKGEYPIGLRLTLESIDSDRIFKLRRDIADTIVFKLQRHEYSFVNLFKSKEQKEELLKYLIDPEVGDKDKIPRVIPDASKPQIYLLRGILAYSIFEHCLSMRCGVDFGVPSSLHIKRIAVPYEAADIPSKTSEYEQPDVSILLSYVAYYTKGLSQAFFDQCLRALLELSKTSKQMQYEQWIEIMENEEKAKLEIETVDKINYNSKAHREYLFKTFRKNRKTISFWLIKCIFLKDLKQYAKSICSSAWDLADVKRSVGFSGTKDNRWLYSNLLKWSPCRSPEIMGTDGKMVHLITKFTNEVALIEENNKTLWQRFIDLALEKRVGCIIDAGAICVGKSLRDDIVPWIAEHQQFDSDKFVGISFCDNSGQWFVYDIQGKFYIPRGTTTPDHQTFVIFDQARTRGADLKMDGDVVAALSLGPELTKDSLMQAAGRLRKLGRNQSLIIMATQQVFSHLSQFPKDVKQYKEHIRECNTRDRGLLPKLIIAWCCENSIRDNHDLLMQFAELGWRYIHSKIHNHALEQELTTDLEVMYSKPIFFATVTELGRKAVKTKGQLAEHPSGQHICGILEKYGKTVRKQAGTLDDVCEREVEAEKQKEKEQQNKLSMLSPIPEQEDPKILNTIESHPFVFDPRFKMTSNLIRTTQSPLAASATHEVPEVYFLKVSTNEIVAISIREASKFIEKHIINNMREGPYEIYMLNSLKLDSKVIKDNNLEGAFVSAKFVAGGENYSSEEEAYLLEQLNDSARVKKEWREDYNSVASLFLRLKRTYLKKFKGSTLEKIIIRMHNRA